MSHRPTPARPCPMAVGNAYRFGEVLVAFVPEPFVRMVHLAVIFEVSHERHLFTDTTWPFFLSQILDRFAGNGFLGGVVSALRNSVQDQACPVMTWSLANPSVPACVMPGDSHSHMT